LESELSLGNKIVGIRQSLKALKDSRVLKAFIAKDVELSLIDEFIKLCDEKFVEIVYVESKQYLGNICGIDRAAMVACLVGNK